MPDENYVNPATRNGGFPIPADGDRERLVESEHPACSGRTRVRLPAALPTRAVRRVICELCEEPFEPQHLIEVAQKRGRPSLPSPRWATLPLAAFAVFAVLTLVRGGNDAPAPATDEREVASIGQGDTAQGPGNTRSGKKGGSPKASRAQGKPAPVPSDATLVAERTFSLALPAGWERVTPAAGATFAAVSPDSTADVTLWIQNDPKLDMATFEANSLAQLETLAGSAQVVDRELGPTVESSSITLAPKKAVDGAPTYEVVLRASGDNWYYLATTHQALAPADAVSGVDLIQGSFIPQGSKR